MVGTIAEIHLHDSARQRVRDILPAFARGHIAPIAAWPDRIRREMPWYVWLNDGEAQESDASPLLLCQLSPSPDFKGAASYTT
jgi:hypothetical protein